MMGGCIAAAEHFGSRRAASWQGRVWRAGTIGLFVLGFVALISVGESKPRFARREGLQPQATVRVPATAVRARHSGPDSSPVAGFPPAAQPDGATRPRVVESYGKLPLRFEANVGQVGSQIEGHADPPVKFLSRGSAYTLFLTADEAVLALATPSRKFRGKSQMARGKDEDPEIRNWKIENRGSKIEIRPSFNSFFLNPDSSPSSDSRLPTPAFRTPNPESRAPSILRIRPVGANPSPLILGVDELPGVSNYLIGSDPKNWHTNVPSYARVRYEDVYPGIDLVYYGNQRQLEYDFVVSPGADPAKITLEIVGATSRVAGSPLQIDTQGDLVIPLDGGEILFHKPVVYQVGKGLALPRATRGAPYQDGRKYFLEGRYVLKGKSQIGFQVGACDPSKPIVIDPVLTYSTYLGGGNSELADAIALDSSGNAYVTGYTRSTDFPTTAGAFRTAYGGGPSYGDIFVTKLNAAGSAAVYSTYLGGSDDEVGTSIAVDSSGDAYLTGYTRSSNFPTTPASFQTTFGGGTCGQLPSTFPCGDAFVAKLNAAGNGLVYSTYLAGGHDDWGFGIALDSSTNAYVTGYTESTDFPTTPGAFETVFSGGTCGADPCSAAFVTKLSADGSALVYSTYLGGSGDRGYGIAVDSSGNAHITGSTDSTSFPTTAGAFQTVSGQNGDAFVAKLKPDGSGLVYSTYLGGGGGDVGTAIAVDLAGDAYVTGLTDSANFPATPGALRGNCGGCLNAFHDAFVTKLNAAGSALIYSTFLRGSKEDLAFGIAVDSTGTVTVTGRTLSTDFPTSSPFQGSCAGGCSNGLSDAFVARLNTTGSALIYSTYLGGGGNDSGYGIALDSSGNAYLAGSTTSSDLITTIGAFERRLGGAFDAFVAKIDPPNGPAVSLSATTLNFANQVIGTTSRPQTVTLQNIGSAPLAVDSLLASGDFSETNGCGSSIEVGATCTISVTFSPTAAGSRTGTITISDNASGSPQIISLSGTGISNAAASLSTTAVSFSDQPVGVTSSPETLSLTNTGNSPLMIASIAISGDFSQTNTCGASLAGGANCTITLTFTPTATGSRTGALTIADNANGSPQTVALSGTAVSAYQLSAASGSGVVIKGADSANFTISASSRFGFSGKISLACSGNFPANCVFSPVSIAPGESATLTVSNLKAVTGNSLNFTIAGTSGSESVSLSLSLSLADFSLSASPADSIITAGQTSTYNLALTPIAGFNRAVSLTCSGAPLAASCSISPTSFTLNGSNNSNAAVTVTTTSRSMAARPPITPPAFLIPVSGPWVGLFALANATLVGWLFAWPWLEPFHYPLRRAAARRGRVCLGGVGYGMAAVLVMLAVGTVACGGGGGGGTKVSGLSGTPAGTYTLTITGAFSDTSSGTQLNLAHSTTVTLTVK